MLNVELPAVWQDEVQQQIFRQLLSCNSLPGTIADLTVYLQGSTALIGVLATLLDNTVTLHDVCGFLKDSDRRFLNSPDAPLSEARFIIADGGMAPDADFNPSLGTLDSPEFGATVILQGEEVGGGELILSLAGAGISPHNEQQKRLSLMGFHQDWFICRQEWVAAFPLGIDLILVDKTKVTMIPRTTLVEI